MNIFLKLKLTLNNITVDSMGETGSSRRRKDGNDDKLFIYPSSCPCRVCNEWIRYYRYYYGLQNRRIRPTELWRSSKLLKRVADSRHNSGNPDTTLWKGPYISHEVRKRGSIYINDTCI